MRLPHPAAAASILSSVCLVLLGVLPAAPARAIAIGEIPSPRPSGWSVDTTGRIPRESLRQLDLIGNLVQSTNGAEIAVVVVDTTGGVPSRPFATGLFNAWGIGERGRNNGILLFAALDDRKVEILLGRGLVTPSRLDVSEAIVQGEMVPRFRQGDPGGALLAGTRACARRLLDVSLPGADGGAEGIATAAAAPRNGLGTLGIAGLVFGALLWGGYKIATRPRRCPECRTAMTPLSAADAASHLTPTEQTEARLGSVRLEAFRCPACGTIDKRRRYNAASGYHTCPECGACALWEGRKTLRQPTRTEEGLMEIWAVCRHCNYRVATTGTTPRLGQPSSFYDGGSSSSSSDSFSSSSSSSDSGFSGGSSGGDGASGSW
jgi:uncharacterized protein